MLLRGELIVRVAHADQLGDFIGIFVLGVRVLPFARAPGHRDGRERRVLVTGGFVLHVHDTTDLVASAAEAVDILSRS